MGNTISTFVDKFTSAVKNIFRAIAPPIVRYVVEHPIRTLSHVVSGILLLAPSIVTAPLLAAAGFASGGITAGSMAAAVQSGMGVVRAGSTFAVLQTAAMGGYGAAAVANAAAGAAVGVQAVGAAVHAVRR